MRILYLSSSYVPSRRADSVHVMRMCAALARRGHEVELAVKRSARVAEPGVGDPFDFYGVEASFAIRGVGRPAWRGGGVVFTAGLLGLLLRSGEAVDLVYSREITGAVLASLLGRRTVFEAHGAPRGAVSRRLYRHLATSACVPRLVAISRALAEDLARCAGGEARHKLVVAPDAADPPPPAEAAERILLPGSRPGCKQVGYVGHLYPGRGVGLILRIAARVPECDFHLIGGHDAEIERHRRSSPSANVLFQGFVPPGQLAGVYRGLDLLLMPYQRQVGVQSGRSDTSGWMSPMKLFEYMAAGQPILSSDLPVLREVLEDGVNALLLPPDDAEAWSAAIRRLLADETLARRLGGRAKADLVTHYTWDARARKVLDGL